MSFLWIKSRWSSSDRKAATVSKRGLCVTLECRLACECRWRVSLWAKGQCGRRAYVQISLPPEMPCPVSALPCPSVSLEAGAAAAAAGAALPVAPFSSSTVSVVWKTKPFQERVQRVNFCSAVLISRCMEKVVSVGGKCEISIYFEVTLTQGPWGKHVLSIRFLCMMLRYRWRPTWYT